MGVVCHLQRLHYSPLSVSCPVVRPLTSCATDWESLSSCYGCCESTVGLPLHSSHYCNSTRPNRKFKEPEVRYHMGFLYEAYNEVRAALSLDVTRQCFAGGLVVRRR